MELKIISGTCSARLATLQTPSICSPPSAAATTFTA
jgi:hypothetical protein